MKSNKDLCIQLLKADSEDEVISLLKSCGYWEQTKFWRHYGDVENNWGQSGNQQSLAEAALAEKIVNSVDARLINECWTRGIDPESTESPSSIRAAVGRFFDNCTNEKLTNVGEIRDWSDKKTREIAKGITLAATGTRPKGLNITIADCGEGQSPNRLPDTILSLSKSNKQYIKFVQGQFNQGGTGALRFCGKRNLQLVVSKRNPELLAEGADSRDREWGFTVVRREIPGDEPGTPKNSVYTYLAPIGLNEGKEVRKGDVLSFAADEFPIFPDESGPYTRKVTYGTAVKMYDYKFLGERSNILRGKSLLSRLDLLLPKIGLPVRLFEYRKNKEGKYLDVDSRSTTLSGLLRRIENSSNIELKVDLPFQLEGGKLMASVYAFAAEGSTKQGENMGATTKRKLGGARGYRKHEGIVFMRNGQTQASLPKDFFRRDAVKMKPLADDILVFVDCDKIPNVVLEDLFMPSRDRLANNDFKQDLVKSLERAIRDCEELKALRNKRQEERMNERLQDDKPLTDVLQSLIKNSPNLTTLLQLGQRISTPFSTIPSGSDDKVDFIGKFYPTFFKCKGTTYGETLIRTCSINRRMRLTFETDARNDYFTRGAERGDFDLMWLNSKKAEIELNSNGPIMKNGIATVMANLPDVVNVGDEIELVARTKDANSLFENQIKVIVKPISDSTDGGGGGRKPPTTKDGKKRERPNELEAPRIQRVYRKDWEKEGFNEFTAMRVENFGYSEDGKSELHEFKVNMDNTPLLNEAKLKRLSADATKLLKEQFLYANVLVGISLLLEEKRRKKIEKIDEDNVSETVEDQIDRTCRALAPFLPALISLGAGEFDTDDVDAVEGLEESA